MRVRYPVMNLRPARMGGMLEDYQNEINAFKEKFQPPAYSQPGPNIIHEPPPSGASGTTYGPVREFPKPPEPWNPKPSGGPITAKPVASEPDPNLIQVIVPPRPPEPAPPTYPGVVTGYPTRPPEGPPPPYKPGPLPTQSGPVATPGAGTDRFSTIPVCRSCGLNSGFQMISDLDLKNQGINPSSCRSYPDSYCNPEPPFEGEPTELPPTYEPVPSVDRAMQYREPPPKPVPSVDIRRVPVASTDTLRPPVATGVSPGTPTGQTMPTTQTPATTGMVPTGYGSSGQPPGVASVHCPEGQFDPGTGICRGSVNMPGGIANIPGGLTASGGAAQGLTSGLPAGLTEGLTSFGGGGLMGRVRLIQNRSMLGRPSFMTMPIRIVGRVG